MFDKQWQAWKKSPICPGQCGARAPRSAVRVIRWCRKEKENPHVAARVRAAGG